MKLSELQEAAAERGEPEMACYACSHFRFRTDSRTFVGRCAKVDEEQFEFGVCFEFERSE